MPILEAKNLSYFYQDGENRCYILKNTDIPRCKMKCNKKDMLV